jgi:Aspartyl protease
VFEVLPRPMLTSAQTEVCFDRTKIVVIVQFNGQALHMMLDTGSDTSVLYPPFASFFPTLIASSSKKAYKLQGIAGSAHLRAALVPKLRFQIGFVSLLLKHASVLLDYTTESSYRLDGILGTDLLGEARDIELDFNSMTLKID